MSENKSRFATIVPTVEKFPLWILIAGWFLVFANVSGSFSFAASIPGLGTIGADQQAALMLAARQVGQGFILGYGLLQKNVRTLQFLWAMCIIRESIDFAARLISGQGFSPIMFIVTLAVEVAAFIYLGAIASGHVAKYKKA
ncbi:MAG: hypothetical protein NTW69_01820 [Chloroflexi bacterium]|nr:hypothetical protein [Chloroflexota bacterium]